MTRQKKRDKKPWPFVACKYTFTDYVLRNQAGRLMAAARRGITSFFCCRIILIHSSTISKIRRFCQIPVINHLTRAQQFLSLQRCKGPGKEEPSTRYIDPHHHSACIPSRLFLLTCILHKDTIHSTSSRSLCLRIDERKTP